MQLGIELICWYYDIFVASLFCVTPANYFSFIWKDPCLPVNYNSNLLSGRSQFIFIIYPLFLVFWWGEM